MAKVSVFEKTMQACRGITDSTKPSKNLTEKKKISSKRFKKESDESDEDEDIMMDVQDDIVAVVDPDIDADEMTEVALGFQQLVDDAGANEIPETDEYLGDSICGCPVCGAKFFNENPLTDGGKCPVCGNEADGFVSVGKVEKADTSTEDEEGSDEDSEEQIDFSDAEIEISDEKKKARKESTRRSVRRPMRKESARKGVRGGLNLDEKTFNRYLNKFIREHYKNAIAFNVVGAKLKGTKLTLECAIKFKSGKTNKTTLVCNYNRNSKFMSARDSGVFKTESKSAPFMFKISTRGNVIRCEGMKCKFVTTAKVKNESKKVQVTGTYVSEGRKLTRRPTSRVRATESRRAIRKPIARRRAVESRLRRPMVRRTARRVAESRKAIRRPLTRRTVESRRLARRVRPTTSRVSESRRVARRPMTRRTVENRRLATSRRAVRPMRSESARVRKPVVRRSASVRSESIRRARNVRSMRSESRMAKRNAIRRTRR